MSRQFDVGCCNRTSWIVRENMSAIVLWSHRVIALEVLATSHLSHAPAMGTDLVRAAGPHCLSARLIVS